ncbi:hypothetical protein MTR67_006975 [Solanum verrucosum]|uniref:Uncharacterized protein n=1 Tax=Solanum verrucosum TaxID=315347 RepID=A0AAF0Q2F7_SOLVR|nr:hypothetical protein MTR67_006975 [Solanum verrucosum]
MAELWTTLGWRFNFRRQFSDWEIPRMADFINKIEQFSGLGTYEDELWWKGDEKGTYKNHKTTMEIVFERQRNSMEHAWENYRGLNKLEQAGFVGQE